MLNHENLAKTKKRKYSLLRKLPCKYHRWIPNAKAVFEAVSKSATKYIRKCIWEVEKKKANSICYLPEKWMILISIGTLKHLLHKAPVQMASVSLKSRWVLVYVN